MSKNSLSGSPPAPKEAVTAPLGVSIRTSLDGLWDTATTRWSAWDYAKGKLPCAPGARQVAAVRPVLRSTTATLIGIGHAYGDSSAGFVEQEAFAMCRQVDVCDLDAQVLCNNP